MPQYPYFRNTFILYTEIYILINSFLLIFVKILSDIGFCINLPSSVFLLSLAYFCLMFPNLWYFTVFEPKTIITFLWNVAFATFNWSL